MKKKINAFFVAEVPENYPTVKDHLRWICHHGRSILFDCKRKFIRVQPKEKKYNVSICAIFKNEAPYLREWIAYNHVIGVEHFYLYNNNSEDNYMEVLQDYIDEGIVTLHQWEKNHAQMECYMDGIRRYSEETKWLGFLDIDEFIVPKSTNNVYDFLKPFEKNSGAVKIYWKMFGTSGRVDRDYQTGYVTEDFVVSWSDYYDIGKCFYNTAFDFDYKSKYVSQLHHKFWANYKGCNIPPVNIYNRSCAGDYNKVKGKDFPIQINHYFTKSYSEYVMKRNRGDVYFSVNPHDEEYFYSHEMVNCSADYSAYKYLIRMKMELERKNNE